VIVGRVKQLLALAATGIPLIVAACSGGDSGEPSVAADAGDAANVDGGQDAATDGGQDAAADGDADGEASTPDGGQDAPADAPDVGPSVISLHGDTYIESEPSVAVGPGGRVAVAWIAYLTSSQEPRIGYSFSSDDGKSFSPPQLINGPLAGAVSGDPAVALDSSGTAYLVWLSYPSNGPASDSHVYLASAPPGAGAFGAPKQIDQTGVADKPWIAIDSKGRIYVTWSRASAQAKLAVSLDGTSSFSESTITTASDVGMVFPCVSPNAEWLYATYSLVTPKSDGGTPSVAILASRSHDQGATWTPPVVVDTPFQGEPASADPPNCAASNTNAWFTYGTGTDGVAAGMMARSKALFLARTDPSFKVDARVAYSDAAGGDRFLHPALIRAGSGALHVSYFTGKDPDDGMASVRRTASNDQGLTWSASTPVSPPVLHLLPEKATLRWLGDYMGLAHRGASLYVAYASNEGKASHIAFSRVAAP